MANSLEKKMYVRDLAGAMPKIMFLIAISLCASNSPALGGIQEFDIPEGAATQSLRDFSAQARLQILFNLDSVGDLTTREVRGVLSPSEALKMMLSGTGLGYDFVNDRTVAVLPTRSASDSSRVAARNSAADESDKREAKWSNKPQQTSEPQQASANSDGTGGQRLALPEILVRGSHSSNADIQRTRDDIQPYVVFDREKIARSNAATIGDFLKSQLPMNTASREFGQDLAPSRSPQGAIDLRGLGTNQTLILIDGRRLAHMSTPGGAFAQTDISGIPLASIERIEVLPTSAGAIYGGAATGGVVNIIRKRQYSGLDLGATYGNSFAGDVWNVDYYASGGLSFAEGRTSLTFSGSYSEGSPLLSTERSFADRGRELLLQNNPSALAFAFFPPASTRSNVCAAFQFGPTSGICSSAFPLTLDDGTPVGSSIASVPAGYAGAATDGGRAFLGTGGQYNLAMPVDGQYLLRTPRKDSVGVGFRQQLASWLEFQLNGSRTNTEGDQSASEATLSVFVPATAASNPFQQGVLVTVPIPGIDKDGHSESQLSEGVASLIAHLPRDWSLGIDRTWSRTSSAFHFKSGSPVSVNGLVSLQNDPRIFQDFGESGLDLTSYLTAQYDFLGGPFVQILEGTSLRASGPALQMGGGPLTVTALVERKDERSRDAFQANQSGFLPLTTFIPRQYQVVNSFYLEGLTPLVSSVNSSRWLSMLELQASVRRDTYTSDSAQSVSVTDPSAAAPEAAYFRNRVGSTDYLVGARYSPIPEVTLRASIGTAFLPPGVNQIIPRTQPLTGGAFLRDPRRGNSAPVGSATLTSSGNPELRPEDSKSKSVGLIVSPSFLEGLRLSLDYTRITKTDEITAPGIQFFIDNEALYPGRIIRGDSLPSDPSGWAGPIAAIDASLTNLFSTSVNSLDIQLDYSWPTAGLGRFSVSSVASHVLQFERKVSINSPAVDSSGFSDGPLTWRGALNLAWDLGSWTANWNTQFFNEYRVVTSTDTSNQAVLNQGAETIPSQLYHDVALSYRAPLGSSMFDGLIVSVGIQNIFNKSPPIVVPGSLSVAGYASYSAYGDPRLRRYTLSIQKSFGR